MDRKAIDIPVPGSTMQCVAFEPDGHHLVGADSSGNLRKWKVNGGEEIGPAMKVQGRAYATVVSMDGRWIVGAGDIGNSVIVWNADTHQIAIEISEHSGFICAVDVSSDSTRIASGSDDCTVRVFNVMSGVSVIPSLPHNDTVVGVKFSPDNSRIATATFHADVGIYDSHSGDKLFDILDFQIGWPPISPLAWSSDGQLLIVGGEGKVASYDTSASFRSEFWPFQNVEHDVSVVTHGKFVACLAGTSVSFWDYVSRQQIGHIVNHATRVYCISISHDGMRLACAHDGGITVHDLCDFLPRSYLRFSRVPLMQLRDTVLESWILGSPADTERMLSDEIAQNPNPDHYMYAARSLIRAHLRDWKMAIENAEMSLQIKHSHIGQIAMSLALTGVGKLELALDNFDFAFLDVDPGDTILLWIIKSVLVFMCGNHELAVARLRRLLTSADENMKGHYIQVLGYMYLKQGDYENAVQTLEPAEVPSTPRESNPLTTISLIFGWSFEDLKVTAWRRLCESLYTSGRIKELGEALTRMVVPLSQDEKEPAHGRVLEALVTCSGQVKLLTWTGKSSKCNSCLPSSPAVYNQNVFDGPQLERDELDKRMAELREVFPFTEAMVIYDRLTRVQPVRFAHFRLLLPCVVFGVTRLRKAQGNNGDDVYRAEAAGLGEVAFTTTDPQISLKSPRRLVFADARIQSLNKPRTWEDGSVAESDMESDMDSGIGADADADAALVHTPIIEEVPPASSVTETDAYARALELIAHLGQPFSALLLLRQSDGTYKRVATDHEIVARWSGSKAARDIRVEVLEIV